MRLLLRPINLLLFAGPVGLYAIYDEWGIGLSFTLLALSVIPLAGLIAGFTDVIADKLGDRIGGLMESTLGNAAFIIIGIISLVNGLDNLVKASIAGAIISNTLFVLGLAFFLGTSRGKRQTFNADTGTSYSKLLALTVVALVTPAIAKMTVLSSPGSKGFDENIFNNEVSLISAGVLVVLYLTYLLFDIFHFRDLAYKEQKTKVASGQAVEQEITMENANIREFRAEREKDEEQRLTTHSARRERVQEINLHPLVALLGLAAALVVTVIFSESLVQVIEALTKEGAHFAFGPWDFGEFRLSEFFVGLVVIPLIGTAAEHISAIRSAMDGRTEITVAVTAGAAIQVALLAAPIFVFVSWFLGGNFDLFFDKFQLGVFALAAFLFYLVTEDGEGSWLEGVQLLAFYIIFAVVAFFMGPYMEEATHAAESLMH
jgi:Ca2+:H+ antiporter